MLCRESGRVWGLWVSLGCLVLTMGCGTGTDPAAGGALAGVTTSADVASPTVSQDEWGAVKMDEMATDRSTPESERRNPFRFGVSRAPQAGSGGEDLSLPGVPGVPRAPVDRDVIAAPGGDTTIGGAQGVPLSFVGFVESPGVEGRVVVLTDGEVVHYGRVGDVIDGRYRIVGLGLESVDLERIDGQGTQTLRLPSESSGVS